MQTFYRILGNTLVASFANSFLWFALTFWAYLETRSVLATAIIGGSFMLLTAVLGIFFGTFIDRHKKKTAMLYSGWLSLAGFSLAALLYYLVPEQELLRLDGLEFWALVLLILGGAVAGNLRLLALSTTVTLLVPEKQHDRANGMIGVVNGVAFAITSVFSGLAIAFLGMGWSIAITLFFTILTTTHLLFLKVPEETPHASKETTNTVDFKGALRAVRQVPGLLALVFFATFNNFLGGVFMSLTDPYGLNLVSVEAWGFIWGFLSFGFIVGGMIVAKKGLGKSPLRTLFLANVVMWIIAMAFPVKSHIVPLIIGFFIYMILIPIAEASEQTIIQRVVPFGKQGRVFGFAQTLESAASPLTAFLIGPIAQFWVIPFMTNGYGAQTFGSWFGAGPDRGMALIFIVAGAIGLVVTLLAMKSKPYKVLSSYYDDNGAQKLPAVQEPVNA